MKKPAAAKRPAAAMPLAEDDEALAETPKKVKKEDDAPSDDACEGLAVEGPKHSKAVLDILQRLPENAEPTGGLEVG
eukprot:9056504-Pyramimonas_sp.AAC.1